MRNILLTGLLVAATPIGVAWVSLRGTTQAASVAVAETGSITGTFISKARLLTRGETSQRDIVLYLKAESEGQHAAPGTPVVVSQKKLQFDPHVVPVLKGTVVVFENLDKVTHNVFASDECCEMDSDMDGGGQGEYTFDVLGVASIVCRVHPDMSLWVIVLENPWFTHVEVEKIKVDGKSVYQAPYTIEDVPPGTYTLTYWNKKLKSQDFTVTVTAGEATSFEITVDD